MSDDDFMEDAVATNSPLSSDQTLTNVLKLLAYSKSNLSNQSTQEMVIQFLQENLVNASQPKKVFAVRFQMREKHRRERAFFF
jgi:hypothetical protein